MSVGVVGVVCFLGLVLSGLPIAYAMLGTAVVGYAYLSSFDIMVSMLGGSFMHYIAKYGFTVLPMFILMGQIGYHTGLLADVFDTARKWFAWMRGGLAVSVVAANAVFAACSGSAIAAVTVIGQASVPAMRSAGYDDRLSTGVVTASGTLAALIPPSATICTYGLIADQSIGKLLIGGILPGIISAIIYIMFIMARSRRLVGVVRETYSWSERLHAIKYLWVVLAVIVGVMGGIYFGICTPTEGGGFGAFTVLLLSIVRRSFTWRRLWTALRATVITVSQLSILIAAAVFFANFLSLSGFTGGLNSFLRGLDVSREVIFLIMTGVYFLLGCVVSPGGMMVMTIPIFLPLMTSLGFDPIWFGIIVVKYCEMAFITPPVGLTLFAMRSIHPEISMETIVKGAAPFLLMDLLTIAVLYAFPEIVTYLPNLM